MEIDESKTSTSPNETYCILKNDTDDYLLHLEEILKNVHKSFYTALDEMPRTGIMPNLKILLPRIKRLTLKGTSIVFTGVVPTNQCLETSKPYFVARSLGADIATKITNSTTHVVAGYPGTAKVNKAKKYKEISIVTPDWLWACSEMWIKMDEKLFPLNEA